MAEHMRIKGNQYAINRQYVTGNLVYSINVASPSPSPSPTCIYIYIYIYVSCGLRALISGCWLADLLIGPAGFVFDLDALQGTHFASRVSASILTALGMTELISHSVNDYRDRVLHLAADGQARRRIREKIADNLTREPLFDTPRFVRNLEKAYMEIWQRHRQGSRPSPLAIGEMP